MFKRRLFRHFSFITNSQGIRVLFVRLDSIQITQAQFSPTSYKFAHEE